MLCSHVTGKADNVDDDVAALMSADCLRLTCLAAAAAAALLPCRCSSPVSGGAMLLWLGMARGCKVEDFQLVVQRVIVA